MFEKKRKIDKVWKFWFRLKFSVACGYTLIFHLILHGRCCIERWFGFHQKIFFKNRIFAGSQTEVSHNRFFISSLTGNYHILLQICERAIQVVCKLSQGYIGTATTALNSQKEFHPVLLERWSKNSSWIICQKFMIKIWILIPRNLF